MTEITEITAILVAKVLNLEYITAWRRVNKLQQRKGITERRPTIGEFCEFYKYDINMFLK
jgi:hypothetical protein